MLSRPTASTILKHPFFWDKAKQLGFFQVSNWSPLYFIYLRTIITKK